MQKINKAPVIATIWAFLSFFVFNVSAQEIYNLKVPTGYCKLVAIDSCFNSKQQTAFDVGSEVTTLSNLYTFCTQIQKYTSGKPARIILALDASSSMCEDATGCTGSGRNDPTNKRVKGAQLFVDSVAAKCSLCEIGLIVYKHTQSTTGAGTVSYSLDALPLNSAANIQTIKSIIDDAKCPGGAGKIEEISKLAKIKKTYTGMALDSAIALVDKNYDAIKDSLERHVILLTDGDWQTPSTPTILTDYRTTFPGRPLPTIHSVFLSDSAWHVSHNFPAGGALSCDSGDTQAINNLNLKMAADSTHGLYVPGSTPENIVNTFNKLFKLITVTSVVNLQSVVFIDSTTNQTQVATFSIDPADPQGNHFIVHVPEFTLQYGMNRFATTMITKDSTGKIDTVTSGFTVNRRTTQGTGTTQVFKTECFVDTVNMNIHCKPNTMLTNEFDTATAKVAPQDTNKFVPNNVIVRAFTPFPDGGAGVVALFHFDDKTLVNSASSGQQGAGSPSYSSIAAFGSAISSGSFTTTLPSAINGDFIFECWIRPGVSTKTASIASGAGFAFGVDNGYLTATIGGTPLRTTNAIDTGVWQHVAVARVSGSANIYINGIPMAVAIASPGSTSISGVLTIGNFSGGALDEVRISSTVSTSTMLGQTLLQIPTAGSIAWNIKQVKSTSSSGILPQDMWQGTPRGQLQFQFSNTMYGPVVLNFFDTLSSPQLIWSKNGDPVLFWSDGVLVSATLKDTSHDGHLDMIDIKWTDDITIKTVPDINQFVVTLRITTLDGNKEVTLHAASIVSDPANKTFHIILTENQDPLVLETGWSNPTVLLSETRITSEGKWFVVNKVIDGADPIPKSVCFGMTSAADTLRITFSEPIEGASIDVNNLIRIDQNGTRNSLSSLAPVNTVKTGSVMTFTFKPATIQAVVQNLEEIFPGAKSSPTRVIDYCTGPIGILVDATLRDTSHDGHLDLIDIKWTDKITIKTFPTASQFVLTLKITTLDGNKEVTLHASTVVLDSAQKTIHIILTENQDPLVLETGWSNSSIILSEFKITNDNRWLVVDHVLDGADPIPKSACYGFTSVADTLNITFSELINGTAIDLSNLIRIDQNGVQSPLSSLGPLDSSRSGNVLSVRFNPKTIQPTQGIEEIFPNGKSSPARTIDYCHGGPLIDHVDIGPNPFIPGLTTVKGRQGVLIRMELYIPAKIARGWYTVFDAVGNVLAKDLPMDPDGVYSLSALWDGKNKKGMYAAGGTYLMRATAENTYTGQQEMRSGKIGIKTHKK